MCHMADELKVDWGRLLTDVPMVDPDKFVSAHLCDALSYRGRRELIGRVVKALEGEAFSTIACRGVSGLLIAPGVAERMQKHLIVVRKGEAAPARALLRRSRPKASRTTPSRASSSRRSEARLIGLCPMRRRARSVLLAWVLVSACSEAEDAGAPRAAYVRVATPGHVVARDRVSSLGGVVIARDDSGRPSLVRAVDGDHGRLGALHASGFQHIDATRIAVVEG